MRKELSNHRIKRSLAVGFLMGTLLLLGFNMVQAQETRAPKVGLLEPMFDFKEVLEGEIINHSFTIQNKGTEMLRILKVKPG